ncbi:hypothetical protein HIM_05556 [Hirsutella minnesotensis 3608]|uniref:Methyltransferase domain-containing protein n=1 Tax=Hirsutella minnesotensis 3608 TaxID=1043627 RepID=A0A0F7ZP87_9HYPO|nr:hypothetical protein HIM_05556 [Hirsutella minnesotensis 3608]
MCSLVQSRSGKSIGDTLSRLENRESAATNGQSNGQTNGLEETQQQQSERKQAPIPTYEAPFFSLQAKQRIDFQSTKLNRADWLQKISNTAYACSSLKGSSDWLPSCLPGASSTSPRGRAYGPYNTAPERHPGSEVIGVDLYTIQRKSPVPNCTFVRQDVEKDEWPFSGKFDYIHLRYIVTCFDDTRTVIRKAFDSLNPDGYIEFYDIVSRYIDLGGTTRGTSLERWFDYLELGAKNDGKTFDRAKMYPEWCRQEGFVDVEEKVFYVPCGPWPRDPRMKKMGALIMSNDRMLIGDALQPYIRQSGLSQSEIEELTAKAVADVGNINIRYLWAV